MASAVERRLQPDTHNLIGEAERDDSATHRQNVGVVVLPRQPCRIKLVAQRRADTGDLVGRDLFALSTAAEHDAAVGASFGNRPPDAQADRRIIHRRLTVRAVILDGVAQTRERVLEMFFEKKSRVVRANRDAHNAKLYYGSAFRVPASRFVSYEHEASNLEP